MHGHKHDRRLSGDELRQHIIEQHPDSVTAQDHDEDHNGNGQERDARAIRLADEQLRARVERIKDPALRAECLAMF